MRDHVRILAILNIVMGCITALIGVVVLIAMGGVATLVTTSADSGDYGNSAAAAPIIAAVGLGIAIFFLVLALPSILGGWGLLNFRPWARILIIIVSVLHLLNFPFGTALGVYGLWVLLSDAGRRLFEGPVPGYVPVGSYPASAAQAPPPPPPGI